MWQDAWLESGASPEAAFSAFDRLPPVAAASLTGAWRGAELKTGHPLDDLLTAYGWWGKRFTDLEAVHPLLFEHGNRLVSVDPARLPLSLALTCPRLARVEISRKAFQALLPLLKTSHPKARLRDVAHRGAVSAAMIYDDLPIIDHFRRIDDHRVLGLMDHRVTPQPFFFLLSRTDWRAGR